MNAGKEFVSFDRYLNSSNPSILVIQVPIQVCEIVPLQPHPTGQEYVSVGKGSTVHQLRQGLEQLEFYLL